jgi:hypothetical protein
VEGGAPTLPAAAPGGGRLVRHPAARAVVVVVKPKLRGKTGRSISFHHAGAAAGY